VIVFSLLRFTFGSLRSPYSPNMVEKLAVDGGKPVRDVLLPYGQQNISDEDIAAVVKVGCSPFRILVFIPM
jgi:hypothetical protein